jgi:hypothetical protein
VADFKSYSMSESLAIAKRASRAIEAFLRAKTETIEVINVEDDPYYRAKDIDLIWKFHYKGKDHTQYIEVKGDTKHYTGNYFIETVSNVSRNSPGCFLYTEADYLFYYFVDTHELNSMPMLKAREWFLKEEKRFKESTTWTKNDAGKNLYQTKGRLVPRRVLNSEVKGVKTMNIKEPV